MQRFREALTWAVFLFVAGIFLLLKNLGVFGEWGGLIWGALFAAVGLGFLVWFATGLHRWWRAIPAFTLLSVGGWLILQARNISLGEWDGALVLFGVALGFWAVLLAARRENWWAVVPAGVLTTLGVLYGLWTQLNDLGRLTVLVVGIGLVFSLLYVLRFGQQDIRWSAIPAAAMLLLGLVTLMDGLNLPKVLAQWWPLLLAVAGLGVGVGAYGLRGAAQTVVTEPADEDVPVPSYGASVTELLPEAPEPPRRAGAPRTEPEKPPTPAPVDIYDLIKQQPDAEPGAEEAQSVEEGVVEAEPAGAPVEGEAPGPEVPGSDAETDDEAPQEAAADDEKSAGL